MRGEVHDPELSGVSITVGEVRMSPDLRIATVYVLPSRRCERARGDQGTGPIRPRTAGVP